MPLETLAFNRISFTFDSMVAPLFTDLSFAVGRGWTGIVGANGIGKSTLLELAVGTIQPLSGSVSAPLPAELCVQRTDEPPAALAEFLGVPDAAAGELASILGIHGDWPYRWESLSHGERKRAQIGVALWKVPELFAVDEPTNHLDRDARRMLCEALDSFNGIGLIVSHDRELLDSLCSQCLFLSHHRPPTLRPGGVSAGTVQEQRESQEQWDARDHALAEERRLLKEARRRSSAADAAHSRRSKKGLRWKDSDAREKIDRARISGSDGHAGKLLNQIAGRVGRATARREAATAPPRERRGVTVHGERAKADSLIRTDGMTLALGSGRCVTVPELTVLPSDRIGVVGPNGSGKSTLIRALIADRMQADSVVYIPQEVDLDEGSRLATRIRELGTDELGRVLSTVSRLGSEPEQVQTTVCPSPGETRKLMLALGLENRPELIVMDEPTNHLDLISIRCLEDALRDFVGALLLVSHDDHFLRALVTTYWKTSAVASEGSAVETFALSVASAEVESTG
jgi:ATPase subunit of ABC transporter with duplicated ATPase domains